MKVAPVSLTNIPFGSKRNNYQNIEFSPFGALISTSGGNITVHEKVHGKYHPRVSTKLRGEITTVSWCTSSCESGETKSTAVVGSNSGSVMIFNAQTKQIGSSLALSDDHPTCSQWHPLFHDQFYVGTARGFILHCQFFDGEKTISVLSRIKTGLDSCHFLCVSCNDFRTLIVSNTRGDYAVISADRASVGRFPINSLVDVKLFPYLNNTLFLANQKHAVLYFLDESTAIDVFECGKDDSIVSVEFPGCNESTIVVCFATHAVVFEIAEKELKKVQELHYLRNLGCSEKQIVTTCQRSAIAVMSSGSDIQIYNLRNGKYYATDIIRLIPATPAAIDVCQGTIGAGLENGLIALTEQTGAEDVRSCALSKLVSISETPSRVISFRMLLPHCFIAILTSEAGSIVYFVDMRTVVCKKLKEVRNSNSLKIILAPKKDLFAIVVNQLSILLFKVSESGAIKKFETEIPVPDEAVCTFAVTDKELWLARKDWTIEKYIINVENETVMRTKSVVSYRNSAKPTCCISLGWYMAVASSRGEVVIFDWSDNKPVVKEASKKKAIVHMERNLHGDMCVMLDETSGVSLIALVRKQVMVRQVPDFSFSTICWYNQSDSLVTVPGGSSIVLMNILELTTKAAPLASVFENADLSFQDRTTKLMDSKTIPELIANAENLRFATLHDLLSVLSENSYAAGCMGTNMAKERRREYIQTIHLLLNYNHANLMKQRRIRHSLLLHDSKYALQSYVTTEPDDPEFTLNVLKASFIGDSGSATIVASVAALEGGGRYGDAVDILMLSGQFSQAVRVLVRNGCFELASLVLNELVAESERDELANTYIQELKLVAPYQASKALIALHRFNEAGDLLRSLGKTFEACIIASLERTQSGTIQIKSC